MAVAEAAPRRPWWTRLPASWVQMSPPDDRDRDRDRLDETGAMYRRRWEDNAPPPAPRVQVPIGVVVTLVIYLIGQLAGSVWWAATLSSDVRYLQGDNQKLWEENAVLKLKLERWSIDFDKNVRDQVRETLSDWGYLRVRSKKAEE